MVEWMNRKPKVWKKHRKGETKTVTFTVTEKDTGSGSVGQLLSDFGKELKKNMLTFYHMYHQYWTLRNLKQTSGNEANLMNVDFSENYACKYAQSILATHYGSSNRQIALHTGLIYANDKIEQFCTMSNGSRHGNGAPDGIEAEIKR